MGSSGVELGVVAKPRARSMRVSCEAVDMLEGWQLTGSWREPASMTQQGTSAPTDTLAPTRPRQEYTRR